MLSRLKLEMRHKQLYNYADLTTPIVVQCNADGSTEYVDGLVPFSSWQDFTNDVENLNEFKPTWQASGDDSTGETNAEGSNYTKAVSLEMRFTGKGFQFIYDWLMVRPCDSLNVIEVRITDLDCAKSYRIFEIKLDNTTYKPILEPCIVSMRLREKDDAINNFQKTILEDDWQNWFNKDNNSTKEHPNFIYIVEKRPKFFLSILIFVAYLAISLSVGSVLLDTDARRWIRKLFGICYFCPSPLIRTYIENNCKKYGYTWDTMFDDLPENLYRDACMFYPVENNYQEFDDYTANSNIFFWNNRTSLPFNRFLDELKKLFKAEWYITPNNQLVFKPVSYFNSLEPIADFTTSEFPLVGLEYTFNGNKKVAYGSYQYQLDPADFCTNDIKWRYNTIANYSKNIDNPILEGSVTKDFDFSVTAFNRDGTTEPYFESAIHGAAIVAAAALLYGMIRLFISEAGWGAFAAAALVGTGYVIADRYIKSFANKSELDGCVRISNNQCNVPRILLWDRNTPMNQAKVVSVESPAINPEYNSNSTTYYQDHPTVDQPGFFGGEVKKIYNYPMYFDENFTGNMFDRFHESDNPLNNVIINQDWTGTLDLCCGNLETFGVFQGDYAKIGAVVILERRNGRVIKGRITFIEPDYKLGLITLKGNVLK